MGAAPRHAVEVGRQVEGVAVQPGGVPPLLVGEEEDDIRSICLRSGHGLLFFLFGFFEPNALTGLLNDEPGISTHLPLESKIPVPSHGFFHNLRIPASAADGR